MIMLVYGATDSEIIDKLNEIIVHVNGLEECERQAMGHKAVFR